jgi:hypoxanthine-guanine phosphoribosyltransferase
MVATNIEGRIPLACVDTELTYDAGGRKHVVVRESHSELDLADQDVLVVVAELYSGQDLAAAIDFVEERNPSSFKTMALLAGPTTVVRPDFCGLQTKHEPMAPWRITAAGKKGRI